MSFPKALARCEMQTNVSRIWTRVVDSIHYGDSSYAKHASSVCVCVCVCVDNYQS